MFGLDVAGQEEVTSRLTFTVSTRNRRSQEEITQGYRKRWTGFETAIT